MKIMRSLQRQLMALDRFSFQLCGVCLVVIMTIGTIDVVLGNTIGYRPTATIDISNAMFVTSVFLAVPFVERQQEHIGVDIFVSLMPKRLRDFSDWISSLIGSLVYMAMAYAMWDLFTSSWKVNEHSVSVFSFPIYPVKFAAFVGLTLAALISLLRVTRPVVGSKAGGSR